MSTVYIVSLVFSGLMVIAGIGIAVNILVNMGKQRLGHMTLGSQPPVCSVERNGSIPFDLDLPGKNESVDFVPPIRAVKPFMFDPDLANLVPKCQNCDARKAAFLYKDSCFYFTKTEHGFHDCFEVCANYSDCYFFAYPHSAVAAIIKRNLGLDNSTVWTGGFRSVSHPDWVDIWGNEVDVVDIYDSYCSYLSYVDLVPRSYYYCDFPRKCLCAGARRSLH